MDHGNKSVGARAILIFAAASVAIATAPATAQNKAATYEGKKVSIGRGTAHTIVRTDAGGTLTSIGVRFTPEMLTGLPTAAKGQDPNFPYVLPMPAGGPKTVVDHVVINWESVGHPPAKVYDVPHFDFHFYMTSRATQKKVAFRSEAESGSPGQQPPAELLPAGYIVPPGTAVPKMGVHAVDPSASEFKGQPFTATFIYGYYNKRQTFIEPMASLAYLESKPLFSAPLKRPARYSKPGAYPSAYSVRYDAAQNVYEVSLSDLK